MYLHNFSKLNILQPHGIKHVKLLTKMGDVIAHLLSKSLTSRDNQRLPPAKRQQYDHF